VSRRRSRQSVIAVMAVLAVAAILLFGGLLGGSGSSSSTTHPTASATPGAPSVGVSLPSGVSACALAGLSSQAKDTVTEIFDGGPFPYRQDGVIFDNRERRLPGEPHGYYHEYTVRTPGSADRGTRRVIAGGTTPTAPEVLYYTGNHYASFCLVSGLD
jgi:guanyl-specific ribonuclease Sa